MVGNTKPVEEFGAERKAVSTNSRAGLDRLSRPPASSRGLDTVLIMRSGVCASRGVGESIEAEQVDDDEGDENDGERGVYSTGVFRGDVRRPKECRGLGWR